MFLGRARPGLRVYVGHIFIIGGLFVFSCIVSKYVQIRRHESGVAELLSEGSRRLPSSSSTASNPAVNASCLAVIPQATINKTLRHAEGMLWESTSRQFL